MDMRSLEKRTGLPRKTLDLNHQRWEAFRADNERYDAEAEKALESPEVKAVLARLSALNLRPKE